MVSSPSSGVAQAKTQVKLSAGQDLSISGSVQSEGSSQITSDENVHISGSLTSLDTLVLQSQELETTASANVASSQALTISAAQKALLAGTVSSQSTATVTAPEVTITGNFTSQKALSINASQTLSLQQGANIATADNLTLQTGDLNLTQAQVSVGENLIINADAVTIT